MSVFTNGGHRSYSMVECIVIGDLCFLPPAAAASSRTSVTGHCSGPNWVALVQPSGSPSSLKRMRFTFLTISMLAKKLKLPEYRLRAFIHKQLGFRNFNAMLHKYRIEDAREELSQKANINVPVLTIALTVGYQSITPFNNAFREITGVTPSEYRKRNTSD